jgi:CheY-like chemotaxis protein
MTFVYRKYGHLADLVVMFNCRSNNENEIEDLLSDLILSDYDLPKYSGALSFIEARRRCPDTPFILVTVAVSEDVSIENTQKRQGWKSQIRQ